MIQEHPKSQSILDILQVVKDPEIPVLSLVDLGIITHLSFDEQERVHITITPTFSGCPALDAMKNGIEEALGAHNIAFAPVKVSFEVPWSSDKISEAGKIAIKKHGLAPPPVLQHLQDIDILEYVNCPYCDSANTIMKSPFGPTLCRSLHYCNNCHQAFEQFKPLS